MHAADKIAPKLPIRGALRIDTPTLKKTVFALLIPPPTTTVNAASLARFASRAVFANNAPSLFAKE
jgi:hypothetical protein